MKTLAMPLLVLSAVFAISAHANAHTLKHVVCENSQYSLSVSVVQDEGESAATVSWDVVAKSSGRGQSFMGYLLASSDDLSSFSSSDLGSDLELSGKQALLSVDDVVDSVLVCK